MEQQQFLSDFLIVNDHIDIRALSSLVIDIGNLTRESVSTDEYHILYRYASTDRYAVERLNEEWAYYVRTGEY